MTSKDREPCQCKCGCKKPGEPVWKIPICSDCAINIHAPPRKDA